MKEKILCGLGIVIVTAITIASIYWQNELRKDQIHRLISPEYIRSICGGLK